VATIPLPALSVQPVENPLEQMQKALQLKGMLFGQQLTAADLQGKNLTNQELQLQIDGMQRLRAAQADVNWDPTDTDKATKVLQHYGVPLEVSGRVISAIGQIRQGLQQQSSENLSNVAGAHGFFDDQLGSVKSAPLDSKQSTYESAIQNVRSYVNTLPDGAAKQQMMAEIGKVPPIYDAQWINQQHSQLRTMAQLNEEALKVAQTREASGKGAQSEAAATLDTARVPGAQAESTIQQQNAALSPTARALGGNIPYQAAGGDTQAKRALSLETAQKVAAAQAGVAGAPGALRGVAPHLVAAAAADANKVGQEFADATAAARDMMTFVDMAKSGNKIAYAYSPTEGVLTLNTARGVKRVNMAEIGSYSGAGSAADRVMGFLGKQATGASIPDSVLNDMASLHQGIASNAQKTYASKLQVINQNYGSNFQPVNIGGGGGGTVKMQAPNGQVKEVDPSDVEHYKAQGAKVVEDTAPPQPAFSRQGPDHR
jgi:hypothetical protein